MNTPFDDAKANPSLTRHAAEWGFASLLFGGILAVLAVLVLQINLHLFLGPAAWGASDLRALHNVTIAGSVVLGVMCAASLAFAIRSLVLASKLGQPSALGWAGLALSILALLLWIGTLVDLFEVVDTLARKQGLKDLF
jgi:hypothetical protein